MPFEQPTIWEWALFWVSMALTVYAFWHLVSGLLSRGRVDQPAATKRAATASARSRSSWSLQALWGLADWLIDYIYLPIGRALWRLLVGLWHLPGLLWSGPPKLIQPAPVSIISVPLPATYVAGADLAAHQNAPSAPSAVRPSVSSAPEPAPRVAVPPAVERIMADRSREALLDALVAAGWSTTQIRSHLRGANDALGAEIEAARRRLEAPRVTPLAGRQTEAEFR